MDYLYKNLEVIYFTEAKILFSQLKEKSELQANREVKHHSKIAKQDSYDQMICVATMKLLISQIVNTQHSPQ